MWASIRDYLTPLDVLDMRTAGLKWNCAKLYGEFAALWFFLMTKEGSEEGAQLEWPKPVPGSPSTFRFRSWCLTQDGYLTCLEHIVRLELMQGEWRLLYKGHLLHELICAGGSKWLDGRDRKSLRLTHGSHRLLMPEEAVGWDNSPRKDDVPPPWEDSSDEYEEEHNTWNRGLGLFTLQGSSPRKQQCLKVEEVCKTALTCHFAVDVIYVSVEW